MPSTPDCNSGKRRQMSFLDCDGLPAAAQRLLAKGSSRGGLRAAGWRLAGRSIMGLGGEARTGVKDGLGSTAGSGDGSAVATAGSGTADFFPANFNAAKATRMRARTAATLKPRRTPLPPGPLAGVGISFGIYGNSGSASNASQWRRLKLLWLAWAASSMVSVAMLG